MKLGEASPGAQGACHNTFASLTVLAAPPRRDGEPSLTSPAVGHLRL